MRKSGVKGLGRLLSVLMVAALLMTTAMVPALALDRWEDVVVSVIWTDSQGQQQTTQAFPVPDSAEHAYWATLDASALFSTVQVQVVSSDPAYTFYLKDYASEIMWTQDATALDPMYSYEVDYYCNSVYEGMFPLYLSSQGMPETPAQESVNVPVYYVTEDGQQLDFSRNEDRIAACKWYIDRVRERFAQGNYEHVELAGFYWLREIVTRPVDTQYSYHLTRSDILLPEIADYLHRLNYTFSWIPFYDARGHDDWRKFGFDQVYMQPNHYWKPENDLDSACMKINRAGTSIEFEFEASILSADPHSDICRARMRKYMEYAKKHGIYGTRPLAYYQGSNALYDLSVSTDETDREFFHEFCRFVVNNPVRTQHSGKGNK